MSYGINYDGLKKRETYNEIVDYLENKQEKIKYPNRLAKQIRNTPQLSNLLDGDGENIQNIKDQQHDKSILAMREEIIKQYAMQNNQTEKVIKTIQKPVTNPDIHNIFTSDETESSGGGDIVEEYDNAEEETEKAKEKSKEVVQNAVMSMLNKTGEIMGGSLILVAKGSYNVASGVTKGIINTISEEDKTAMPSDDETMYTGNQSAGGSNDDLDNLTVRELRSLIRSMNWKSLGLTHKQIKGIGEGKLDKAGLIDAIIQLRG
jgi:hypothetical protein